MQAGRNSSILKLHALIFCENGGETCNDNQPTHATSPLTPIPLAVRQSAWDEYFACVVRILVFGTRRNPDVERLVQFVALAAVSVSVSSMDRSVGGQDRRSDGGSRSSSSLARDTGGGE